MASDNQSSMNAAADYERSRQVRPALGLAFRIGPWLVRPELNQLESLHAATEPRHLEPRLMHLLAFMAANPGRVMSREILVEALWPRVIVNENSLTRAVSELRKQLHTNDSSSQTTIQTVPKKGYRLNAVVTPWNEARESAEAQREPGPSQSLISSWIPQTAARRAPGTLAAACLTLVLGAWLLGSPTAQTDSRLGGPLADQLVSNGLPPQGGKFQLAATELLLMTDGLQSPVISADRQRFAFIRREATGFGVYVGQMKSDVEPVLVYRCELPLSNLTWSPLGNALLFAQNARLNRAALFSVPAEPVLLSLDLETFAVSRLVEDDGQSARDEARKGSLT